MNVLQTEAPEGQVYDVQTTTQGVLQCTVAPGSSGGGGGFSDSGTVGISSLAPGSPTVLDLSNAPADFASFVVTGWITVSWVNNESESIEASGAVTIEVSTDSGVTYSSIGDPPGYTMQNPVTAAIQQAFVNIPFVFRGTGPATGNVLVRATFGDNTTGGALAGGQLTAAAVFLPN